jgi:hypothetical protein
MDSLRLAKSGVSMVYSPVYLDVFGITHVEKILKILHEFFQRIIFEG